MKKDKLMQEFESMKIDNANSVYGGMDKPGDPTICDRDTTYLTNSPSIFATTDTCTDRVEDDTEVDYTLNDATYVFLNPMYRP